MAKPQSSGDQQVTIGFEPDNDPIEGWLRGPQGVAGRFTGWLELNSLLRACVERWQDPDGGKDEG